MSFYPKPNQKIVINQIEYEFSPLPAAPRMVWGAAGGKATVYHLVTTNSRKTASALKVFMPKYRQASNASKAAQLIEFADLTGFDVCARHAVKPDAYHNELLKDYPDLEYSILMPWVPGDDWGAVVSEGEIIQSTKLKNIVLNFVDVMLELERKSIAHCDISGGNVMVNFETNAVYLVDVEDIYAPSLEKPASIMMGTPGYIHKEFRGKNGYWGPLADRFAGAIIIAEMLGWVDENVRNAAFDVSYFYDDELQSNCDRYDILQKALESNYGRQYANLFKKAWFSESLEECPTFDEWKHCFEEEVPDLSGFDLMVIGFMRLLQQNQFRTDELEKFTPYLKKPLNILSDEFKSTFARLLALNGIKAEKNKNIEDAIDKYCSGLRLLKEPGTYKSSDEVLYADLFQICARHLGGSELVETRIKQRNLIHERISNALISYSKGDELVSDILDNADSEFFKQFDNLEEVSSPSVFSSTDEDDSFFKQFDK